MRFCDEAQGLMGIDHWNRMRKKKFDCVEMKHQAQRKMRAKIKGSSREDELAFFREGSEEFRQRIDAAKKLGKDRLK